MTQTPIDHDQLFKELLGEFFSEFIDLFFPDVAAEMDPSSIEFQPQEFFADLLDGDAFRADLVVKVRFRNQMSYFIIHLEHQFEFREIFDRRMFLYFALLHRDYNLPVYPIAIFSHHSPRDPGDRSYTVSFSDWEVLRFNYRTIRLNHLRWQEFVDRPNPVASAFMSKMKIRRRDRPQVKLVCLEMLTQLQLNPAQIKLVSGFVDTYLYLTPEENQILLAELDKIGIPERKEGVMQIVTSWMEEGLEQGRLQQVALVARLLHRKLGTIPLEIENRLNRLSAAQLGDLGEALLDFTTIADLTQWLDQHGK